MYITDFIFDNTIMLYPLPGPTSESNVVASDYLYRPLKSELIHRHHISTRILRFILCLFVKGTVEIFQ